MFDTLPRPAPPSVLLGAPRVRLGSFPTPVESWPGLSAAIGVEVWLKRDDLNGLPAPGDAVRRLEFLLGDALAWGADTVVAGVAPAEGGFLAALATGAARAGLDCVAVISDRPPGPAATDLALRSGASLIEAGRRKPLDDAVAAAVSRLCDRGRRPYRIAPAGASAVGCLGGIGAAYELAQQCADLGLVPKGWVVPVTSGATMAGLAVGLGLLRSGLVLAGAAPGRATVRTSSLARATAVMVGSPAVPFDVYAVPPAPTSARLCSHALRRAGVDLAGSPTPGVLGVAGALAAAGALPGPVVVWHPGPAPG